MCCSVLPPEIVVHNDAYISGRSENNINASCMTISGERTKQLDIFCRVTGFTSDFLSFIVVELNSVLSRSHSYIYIRSLYFYFSFSVLFNGPSGRADDTVTFSYSAFGFDNYQTTEINQRLNYPNPNPKPQPNLKPYNSTET